MEERFVTVGGYKIRFLEDGNGDQNLVLLHGLGGYAERWRDSMEYFSKKFHVYAPDLLGYGESDKPSIDYTPELFTKFTFDFIQTLKLQNTSMAGTSLGGQIAAECAATQNPIIKKVVLICPAGIMKKSTPTLDAYTMAALYPNKEAVKTAYKMMIGNGKDVSEYTINHFMEVMSKPNAKMVFLSTLLGLKNTPVVSEKLKMIKIPTLIIWGEDDKLIPIEYAEQFHSLITGSEIHIIKGAGHSLYAEEPKKLAELVIKFLEK